MKRGIAVAGLLLVAVGGFLFFAGGDHAAVAPGPGARTAHRSASPGASAAAASATAQAPTAADEGATPPLETPANESDGAVQVTVLRRGEPVEHARIRLYWRGDADSSTQRIAWRLAGTAASGRDGKATLPARPGRYLVSATQEGFAPARAEVSRPNGEALTRITLNLVHGEALEGMTVAKGRGEPVPLVEIALNPSVSERPANQVDLPVEERALTSSDAQGRFRFSGLAPGRYRLEAKAPGYGSTRVAGLVIPNRDPLRVELYAAGTLEGFVVDPSGKPAPGAEVNAVGADEPVTTTAGPGGGFSLEVPGGLYRLSARLGANAGALPAGVAVATGQTIKDLRITLGEAGRISGVVTSKATRAPIAGAHVAVSPYGYSGDSGRAATGPDGRFEVEALPPGTYDVDVVAPGFTRAIQRAVSVDSKQTFPLAFELSGTGGVEGTVHDPGGHSISGALVRVLPRGEAGSDAPSEARTDKDGHFAFDALPAGIAVLNARRDGDTLGRFTSIKITAGETAHSELLLDDAVPVTGHVTLSSGKAPDGASVSAFPMGYSSTVRVENNVIAVVEGSYRLMLPAGEYGLSAWTAQGPTGPTAFTHIWIHPGEPLQKDLVIPDSTQLHLSGQVLEADGSPAAGGSVTAVSRFPMGSARIAPDGRFDLAVSAQLPLRIEATLAGRHGEATATDPATPVTVTLSPAASLQGTVVGAEPGSQQPLTATVRPVNRPSALGGAESQQFLGESFRFDELEPGAVEVTVRSASGQQGRAQAFLTAGQTQTITVTLETGATVTGRLVNARTGKPMAGQLFYDRPDNQMHAEADPGGRFTFENVPPGSHHLVGWMISARVPQISFTVGGAQNVDLGDIKVETDYSPPGSIGATLSMPNGAKPFIDHVVDDGPAAQAGILPGDTILEVDGQPVTDSNASELLRSLVKGTPGVPVVLTVDRNGSRQTFRVTRAS